PARRKVLRGIKKHKEHVPCHTNPHHPPSARSASISVRIASILSGSINVGRSFGNSNARALNLSAASPTGSHSVDLSRSRALCDAPRPCRGRPPPCRSHGNGTGAPSSRAKSKGPGTSRRSGGFCQATSWNALTLASSVDNPVDVDHDVPRSAEYL